jgi:hypothetical protein
VEIDHISTITGYNLLRILYIKENLSKFGYAAY